MVENPVQFGIMGCARIARKNSRAIRLAQNATLVAIASRSIEKAQRFKADNCLPESVRVHGSYEELLDDPSVEVVYMPLPTSLHVKWAVAAAERKKHLLLEKPVALCVEDFDKIVEACDKNGVQFMDGTMGMHHPRTAMMEEVLSDASRFGKLKAVRSMFSFAADSDFLKNNIRVKPDLDSLGALGDTGWYCIRSILWAADFELPKAVTAFPNTVTNDAGVILSCGSSLIWEDGRLATFHCSFIDHMTMELCVTGTRGTLHLGDFVIPFEESSTAFSFGTDVGFTELHTGWEPLPSKHHVKLDLPQEAYMVGEFSRLVTNIKNGAGIPEKKWPTISRKTQLVLDAVKISIEKKGCSTVPVADE